VTHGVGTVSVLADRQQLYQLLDEIIHSYDSHFYPHVCVNSEMDLLLKPQKEWVHMDKLEPEKLEWMRDLPAPKRKGTKEVRTPPWFL